jgi:hypothetical protein
MLRVVIGVGKCRVVRTPRVGDRFLHIMVGCFMLRMLTSDRTRPIGESGGSLVGKGGESDAERRHLQGGSCHLSRLRIDGLVPVSKY